MKSESLIVIIMFSLLVGLGIGMVWRSIQVEPVLQARIEFLEDERQVLRERLVDQNTQLGLLQGKGQKKWKK
jgi:hypothetical protein